MYVLKTIGMDRTIEKRSDLLGKNFIVHHKEDSDFIQYLNKYGYSEENIIGFIEDKEGNLKPFHKFERVYPMPTT